MKKSRIGSRRRQSETPVLRHLPLVDILVDTQTERQTLVVASGLKVLEAMLEEDRVAVCGPRYAHQPERRALRAGHVPREVVLGGRKVALRRAKRETAADPARQQQLHRRDHTYSPSRRRARAHLRFPAADQGHL